MSASNLRILTGFVLVGCLMVALCAVQFLPSAELLSHSRRGAQGLRYGETSNWSFHPLLLMEMLVPGFYGPALTSPTSWNAMVEDGNSPYFVSVFTGFVPLFFALAGWALGQDRRRNFVAGSALLILVLSFGHFTPVFSLAYLLVPLLTLVRFPVKLLVPVVMLVAILAGWGLDALRREPGQWKARRNRALFPLAILLACSLAIWAAAWMAPKLIALPTQWALVRQGRASMEAGQMARISRGHVPDLYPRGCRLYSLWIPARARPRSKQGLGAQGCADFRSAWAGPACSGELPSQSQRPSRLFYLSSPSAVEILEIRQDLIV